MRKLMIVTFVAAAAVVGTIAADRAEAQEFPTVAGITAFTPQANFMSLPGYLRWTHFRNTGDWISRDVAVQAVNSEMGGGAMMEDTETMDTTETTDTEATMEEM